MKTIAIAVGTLCTALAPAAFGQYYDNYRERDRDRGRDTARVLESRPVYQAADSRQECWNPRAGHFEEVRDNKTDVGRGAAIGAVAGGVLGHQVDSGGGTAAGAVLGGILGHQLQRRNERDDQPDLDRSRCRVVSAGNADHLQGYEVRYEYRGREFVTRMNREPGNRLQPGRDINDDGTPFS